MNEQDSIKARRDCWKWVEREFPNGLKEILAGRKPKAPLHVEIHPHHKSTMMCNNDCPGCTGRVYKKDPSLVEGVGIKPERLIKTLQSFKGKIRRVVFSGNCTEPLLYPEIIPAIRTIRECGLEFNLYSNFYYADKAGLMEELTKAGFKSYARASIDAGTKKTYNLTHKPLDKNSFEKILSNIDSIAQLRAKKNSKMYMHVTYLLSRHNSSREELDSIIKWASDHKVNSIRFTTYQKPLGKEMHNSSFLSEDKLEEVKRFLEEAKKEYNREDFDIETRELGITKEQKLKSFDKCSVMNVFGVIGFDGGVYPCTAMASSTTPEIYRFGNINTEDYWKIWNRAKQNFSVSKCYDCTRTEFCINQGVSELPK